MQKALIVTILCLLAGCATVEGLGQDISAGASRVRNAI
jgi:predicted small secreted protein